MRYILLFVTLILAPSGLAQTARIPEPQYIAIDSKDNVYIAVKYGIVRITPDGTVSNLTSQARDLDRHWSNLIVDPKDNLYANDGKLVYKFSFKNDQLTGTLFAGQPYNYELKDGPVTTAGFNTIDAMTMDREGNIYVIDSFDKIKDTIGTNYVADPFYEGAPPKTRGHRNYRVIRKIAKDGIVTTLKTADGKYIVPNNLYDIAVDNTGSIVYSSHGRFIGKIDLATGKFDKLAGQPYKRQYCPVYSPGPVATAELFAPETLIINKSGDVVFADQRAHRIFKIAAGKVSTLAGNGVIDPCSQNIGGRAQEGNKDGNALTALFNFPKGMAFDSKGNLYIADMYNHSIRKLSPTGVLTTFAK
jgi:hypothetical protein